MNHVITLGDVPLVVGIPVGLLLLAAIIFGIIALMNPFRSGH